MNRRIKLEAVCKEITVGHVGPMVEEYVTSGIPFFRSQNIQPFRFNKSNLKFISHEFHQKLRKSALAPGDVVVVRTGYPGTACVIPDRLPVANCADLVIIRPSELIDAYFLSCVFNSAWGRGRVAGSLVGVAQQHFNVGAAKEMEILLPSLCVQRRIASILSVYDDLIENNTCRIRILEEMARMIYREWFVNFRFPGHEKVRMVASEMGPIPEGWSIKRFTDLSEVLSGGTPRTNVPEYWGGDIPFFGPRDAPETFYVTETDRQITALGLSKCNSKLYPKETVFITARGTVGRVALPATEMAMNQSCYALHGKVGIDQLFLFMLVRECVERLKKKAHGAVFDTITVETFEKLRVIQPAEPLPGLFGSVIRPFFSMLLNLQQRNSVLRQTRDLLLPRLISGEIRVEQLDTEPVAEAV